MSKLAEEGFRILFVQPSDKHHPMKHALVRQSDYIWLLSVSGLPYERCLRGINKINSQIAKKQIKEVVNKIQFTDYILWLDRVHGFDYRYFREAHFVIYDLIDEILAFGRMRNEKLLIGLENIVLQDADLLISSSKTLMIRKIKQAGRKKESIFIPNGVDCKRFRDGWTVECAEAKPDISNLKIGFIGHISQRSLNFGLVKVCAQMRPNWKFIFVGPGTPDDKRLLEGDNIIVRDAVGGDQIPAVIYEFDVGIIPYNIEKMDMDYVFPRKACEYLAAGKPVVSTPLQEVEVLKPFVKTADNPQNFIAEIESSLQEELSKEARMDFVKQFDWESLMGALIQKLQKLE